MYEGEGGGGRGEIVIVGIDSGGPLNHTTFLAGGQGHAPSCPQPKQDPPPHMPREVGGSPALQLYHIVKDDGKRRVGCWGRGRRGVGCWGRVGE